MEKFKPTQEMIDAGYTNLLELNAEQLERVNKLRDLAGNQLIA